VSEIINKYPANHSYRGLDGYATGRGILVAPEARREALRGTEINERSLNLAADHGRIEDRAAVAHLLAISDPSYLLLEAQCRRAVGLRERDPTALREAEAIWLCVGARPYVARARHEIGRIAADAKALAAGRAELERLGDVDYLDRFDPNRTR
jgi:hypothetical protein